VPVLAGGDGPCGGQRSGRDDFAGTDRREAILRRQPDILQQLVARCCQRKANIVEHDEREEPGLRMVLNYGNTFAHAFETVSGYGTWLHGEAVAAGMLCASRLAERRGLIEHAVTLSGVSATQVRVNDPWKSGSQYWFSKSEFERSWADFNNMAVVLQ